MRAALVVGTLIWATSMATTAAAQQQTFTHADTLRGTNGPARAWWDVTFYDLHVRVRPADSSISGWNGITYRVLHPAQEMQIDLQTPLVVDSMVYGGGGQPVAYRRDGNAFFVSLTEPADSGGREQGDGLLPRQAGVAHNPPWDGGFIWQRDSLGNRWVATANEGLGASVWWPNKDYLADEPDSQRIAITVPDPLQDVSNGRLRSVTAQRRRHHHVRVVRHGSHQQLRRGGQRGRLRPLDADLPGRGRPLTMDFWPLKYHLAAARKQWAQAVPMMRCFEHWFGPYPWYRDGYKLEEAPHLGMEHQSGVAYGNRFLNGYLGRDLSGTGWGLKWDFIIVHESAHEWWGNNITMKDQADMWIHESFANYAENLYTECQTGSKEAGADYVIGTRRRIQNDRPIIAPYGVNAEGSGDMYYKGGNMLHTIRQLMATTTPWRSILRGLNRTFRHQTVTGAQVEEYMSHAAGIDLSKVFQQYLTTTMVPTLAYRIDGKTLAYRWTDVVPGFDMPVAVTLSDDGYATIRPSEKWQTTPLTLKARANFAVDPDYYVVARNVGAAAGKAGP